MVQVRHLKRTALILPEQYPSLTLLRQAIGSVKLGYDALSLLVPEVIVNSSSSMTSRPGGPQLT